MGQAPGRSSRMRVHFELPSQQVAAAWLTIGSFDGVHLAHREVVRRLLDAAQHEQAGSALITFEPHPRCVVDPANCPSSITTLREKLDQLGRLGVEHAVVLEFTRSLAAQSPDEFMDHVGRAFEVRGIVCGPDFAFGHRRAGTIAWLRDHGYAVEVVPAFRVDGDEVHSSEIRSLLTSGEVERANRLLGREFSIAGLVEPGDRIGRTLGYPTINLGVEPNKLVPGHGVYAGWVRVDEGEYMGALSIGYRPTFGGTDLRVEAFLLDFEGDLYQHRVEVRFVCRIRDGQVRFDTPQQLAEQIAKDVEATRRALKR